MATKQEMHQAPKHSAWCAAELGQPHGHKLKNATAAAPSSGGPSFYTVPQLALRWAISERQIHRYLASEELVPTRFGRSVRISAAEVARFEANRTDVK
jgi:hypothetical protein